MDIVEIDASYSIIVGAGVESFKDKWKSLIKGAYYDPLVKRGFKSPYRYFTKDANGKGVYAMNGHLIADSLVTPTGVKFESNATKDLDLPFKPYDFQTNAIKTCLTNSRCLIKMCTGSGKSLVIALLAHILVKSGYKGVLLVPNINLLEQFKSDIKSYNLDFLYDNLEILGGGSHATMQKPLLISTWQSLINTDKRDYDFIIADECHRYSSDVTSEMITELKCTKMRWGFTGTIPDEPEDRMMLEGLFGPVFNLVSARQLIDKGLGTPININALWLSYNNEVLNSLRAPYQTALKFIKAYEPRNDLISSLAIKLLNKQQNTLVLYSHTEHGKSLYRNIVNRMHPDIKLTNANIVGPKSYDFQRELNIYFINGEDDAKTREMTRIALNNSSGSILVANYAVLSTGINIKALHNLIMASPLKSYTTITQSIGRGIRLHDSKSKFNVYDIIDNTNIRGFGGSFVRQYRHRLNTSYQPEGYNVVDCHVNI